MNKTKKLVIAALFASLVCVATMIIKIPSFQGGYVNLGDSIVLVCAWFLSPGYAFAAAAIGSGLADIFACVNWQAVLSQTTIYETASDGIQHCKHGYTQHHSGEAKQSAKEQNGKQDPERSKTGGITQDLGAEDVSVKLLERQNKQHKINALHGRYQQDQD